MKLICAAIFCAGLVALATAARADPCTAPLPRPGTAFSGPVTYVGDGDSLCIALGPAPSEWVEVRVADFYAPELHEPGGAHAKAQAERLFKGRTASCVAGKRSYDRVVARCEIGGSSLGDMLRRAGVQEGGRGR